MVEELRLDIEVKKVTLRLLKRERLELAKVEPWNYLYVEGQQAFFQFHERSKGYFEENDNINPPYYYGILTDSIYVYGHDNISFFFSFWDRCSSLIVFSKNKQCLKIN